MIFGSLFAGIGGIDLGLEWAGMSCKWQVEIDPFGQSILQERFPKTALYQDVREFPTKPHKNHRVDLICGGFPCQPVSVAGSRKGDSDERWLWDDFARIIRLLRPRWILAENVPGLLSAAGGRLFGGILRDLASLGFDAEWEVLSAGNFGAPHFRERLFLLAYSGCDGWGVLQVVRADLEMDRRVQEASRAWSQQAVAASSHGPGLSGGLYPAYMWRSDSEHYPKIPSRIGGGKHWISESGIQRVADGIPEKLDKARLKAHGNAVVPQIAEWIGRRILERNKE